MIGVTVTLTEEELRYAVEYAEAVHANHRRIGASGPPVESHLEHDEMDRIGFVGEFAVSKETGVPLPWDVNIISDGNKHDITLGEWLCQIKTTQTWVNPPQFYFKELDWFQAPIGIYVQKLRRLKYHIWGCISRRKFMKTYYMKRFGKYGDHFCVDADTMSPLSVLLPKRTALFTPSQQEWVNEYIARGPE